MEEHIPFNEDDEEAQETLELLQEEDEEEQVDNPELSESQMESQVDVEMANPDDDEHGTVPATPKQPRPKSSVLKTPKALKTPGTVKKKKKARKSEQVNLHAVSQEQVMVAEMEGTQIVHLKLRKRYYAEALDFIR